MGNSLTRFSSGPDTFALSQSWGVREFTYHRDCVSKALEMLLTHRFLLRVVEEHVVVERVLDGRA